MFPGIYLQPDADFLQLIENGWLELCILEGARSTNIPTDSEPFRPGRWRRQIEMIVTVQAKSTEATSLPHMYKVKGDVHEIRT